MAFCTICGKQLADGEVCTCQQNNAQSVPQGSIPQGMPYTGAPQQGSPYTAAYGAPQQEAPKSSVDMEALLRKLLTILRILLRNLSRQQKNIMRTELFRHRQCLLAFLQ